LIGKEDEGGNGFWQNEDNLIEKSQNGENGENAGQNYTNANFIGTIVTNDFDYRLIDCLGKELIKIENSKSPKQNVHSMVTSRTLRTYTQRTYTQRTYALRTYNPKDLQPKGPMTQRTYDPKDLHPKDLH
jgi:hypothetical protein